MASENGEGSMADFGDAIDTLTFEQILEMDDDDDREFSSSIVFGFFEQAEQTFRNMDDALKKKDLKTLSELGHFLKGSSATLGLTTVKDGCEKIQHYGGRKDDNGDEEVGEDEKFLTKIANLLPSVQDAYHDAERRLRAFYAT